MKTLSIDDVSRATSVKVTTIRFYEEIGLLPIPPRTEGNRRAYGEVDVKRLRFIRHARALGFDVEAIWQLIALADEPDRPCAEADHLARRHLSDINNKIARLVALKSEIEVIVATCAQGAVRDCRVIEVLADHDQCVHDAH